MSIWKHLGDADLRARSELKDVRRELGDAVDFETFSRCLERIDALEARVDRTSLVTAALCRLLEKNGVLDDEQLDAAVLEVDLLDGREDGRMNGEPPPLSAPRCRKCNHYVNPARQACIYCGHVLALSEGSITYRGAAAPHKPEPPKVSCTTCGRLVLENRSFHSSNGVVCDKCFDG